MFGCWVEAHAGGRGGTLAAAALALQLDNASSAVLFFLVGSLLAQQCLVLISVGAPLPPKQKSVPNQWNAPPPTPSNLDSRFKINPIGGIRIGWVINQKASGRPSKRLEDKFRGFQLLLKASEV